MILKSQSDSSQVPLTVQLGLIAFTGIPFVLLLLSSILIWRQIWTDPIYKYLRKPNEFVLAKGAIVAGECVWDSEHRRQSSVWKARVEYSYDHKNYVLFEDFAKEIALTRDVDTKKELKGLSSILPIEVWVLHHNRKHLKYDSGQRIQKQFNIFNDLSTLIKNIWHGEQAAVIALDKRKIDQVAKPLLHTNSDIYLGVAAFVFAAIALFFFTLPGVPDGRWLEVQRQLNSLISQKELCSQVAKKIASEKDLLSNIEQSLKILNEPTIKQLQFDIWNLDFSNIPENQLEILRSVLFEDCREQLFVDYALLNIDKTPIQKAILYWLDDIAKNPRSVARIQMANVLSQKLAVKIGTSFEQHRLKIWSDKFLQTNIEASLDLNKVIQWIGNAGREFAEWQYPFQGRIYRENILKSQ